MKEIKMELKTNNRKSNKQRYSDTKNFLYEKCNEGIISTSTREALLHYAYEKYIQEGIISDAVSTVIKSAIKVNKDGVDSSSIKSTSDSADSTASDIEASSQKFANALQNADIKTIAT